MITLFDLSAEFWRNWFATRVALDAYELTLDRIMMYRDNCERTAVLCDGKNCIRYQWYPEYKGQRDEKPRDALDALEAIKDRVGEMYHYTPVVECEGYEADDLMATLAKQAWPDDVQLVVQDKDLYQLISDNCWIISKGNLIREPECIEKFGVRPNQIRDYLALVGDAADNVPGCPTVGPGRAADLLRRFNTIPGILKATDEEILSVRKVGRKSLEALRAWDPSLAVRLVSLLDDAPVKLEDLWPIAA